MNDYYRLEKILKFLEYKLKIQITKNNIVFYDDSKNHYTTSKLKRFRGKLLVISIVKNNIEVFKRYLINDENFINLENLDYNYSNEWAEFQNEQAIGESYEN